MIQFTKYHGTGNDFIILHAEPAKKEKLIQAICDRHFGIGADGLIYPSSSSIADIKMNYFNSDGSPAKMCGNGLRCFVQYLKEHNLITSNEFKVETGAGVIEVEVKGSVIRLGLGQPEYHFAASEFTKTTDLWLNQTLTFDQDVIAVSLVKQGTLHAIVYVDSSTNMEVLGPKICHSEYFPDDINVNFVEVIDDHTQKVTTYERGAGWTLSCGTGASASAAVSTRLNKVTSPVTTIVPGGTLTIFVEDQIKLQGPAEKIAAGEFEVEV